MTQLPTAELFLDSLHALATEEQRERYKTFFPPDGKDVFIGVPMGKVFALAKTHIDMEPAEIERLMESEVHEARAGAMSIMDKQIRRKKTPESRRTELFDLYLRRHDRIDTWDLVDLAAARVIGEYLFDRPRAILDTLAASENPWQRRSAIVATFAFHGRGELDDTFRIAESLIDDAHPLVNKATGWALRNAGTVDRNRLTAFLARHAVTMPRITLRNAIEHFDKETRAVWLGMAKRSAS